MDVPEYFILSLFLLLGLLSLIASLLNSHWFFHTGSALFFVEKIGLKGARLFYGVLGLILISCSVMGYLSWR
jgi:hypothetical protein